MKLIKKISFVLLLGVFTFSSCSTEDLEPTLAQSKSVEGSITSISNLYSIIKGCHNIMSDAGYYGRDMIANNEVRSDNCFSNGNSGRFSTQAEYQYNAANSGYIWDNAYQLIANANIIINTDITTLDGDQDLGKHYQGMAMTLRALGHYDLLRVYGQQHAGGSLGVPVITEFKGDDLFPSRNSVDDVKAAIYADLEMAFGMMNSNYDTSKEFTSKFVAKALEARVALYFGDWARARDASKAVLDSGIFPIATASNYVSNWSTKQASNVIFELAFSAVDNRGPNALSYIYRFPTDAPQGYGDLEVVSSISNLYMGNDVRKDILGFQDGGTRLRNMKKYPDTAQGADNIPLFRVEEMVLVYAEALFEINNADPEVLTQLNNLTSNRNATAYAAVTKADIINERRKELIFEGFRFDDMMRTGMSADALGSLGNVISTLTYPNNLFAYPIPLTEINANSNMVQNSGYQ